MAYCAGCGAELRPDADFCSQCGRSAGSRSAAEFETPQIASDEPARKDSVLRWPMSRLLVAFAVALFVLAIPAVYHLLAVQAPPAAAPSQEQESGSQEVPGPEVEEPSSAWVIGYVTDRSIVTLDSAGERTEVEADTGARADWSPDRRRVAMLSYARADMAYIDDVSLVSYPSGETLVPFDFVHGQIEYLGWRSDSLGYEWTDLNGGYFLVDAASGEQASLDTPEASGGEPRGEALDAEIESRLLGELAMRVEPPADATHDQLTFDAFPSCDGSRLLLDVRVWRNVDLETALMSQDTSIWMCDSTGENLELIGSGHSPVWMDVAGAGPPGLSAPPTVDKPVVYLYPTQPGEVTVRVDLSESVGTFEAVEPTMSFSTRSTGSWTVTAHPDGTIFDSAGDEWSYLFWESAGAEPFSLHEGAVVESRSVEEFLRRRLAELGLSESEADDFCEFWVPRMRAHRYCLVRFVGEEYQSAVRMSVSPAPDSVIRVFMVFRGLDEPVSIPPQVFAQEPPARRGFTVVEWGGMEIR